MGDFSKEDEDILRELCLCNGLHYEKIKTHAEARNSVRLLEMFFSGCPRLVGLNSFPCLETLILIGQPIDVIIGLDACVNLRELWICECKLKRIGGLEHCCSIEQLYLYSNCISQIENISHLRRLFKLWLNDNRIATIEGLVHLKKLRDLNLAQNRIREIGKSLSSQNSIEVLNLSGNPISSLQDLTNLADLHCLRNLSLQDPQFAPAPACLQCNYATHVLYHMPQLTHLDTFSVTSQALRELVEVTVVRKKFYYNIQTRLLQHRLNDQLSEKEKELNEVVTMLESRIRTLQCDAKQIELELNDESSPQSASTEGLSKNDCLTAKHSALTQRSNELEGKLKLLQEWYASVKECFDADADLARQMLLLELQTGGNVHCEVGKPTDVWYSSCCDLIQNGFCAADYLSVSVIGVRVTNVFKVHNRIMRTEFDSQLSAALEREDILTYTQGRSYKDLIEYFFMVRDSQAATADDVLQALENGGKHVDSKQDAVHLTNNLHAAEKKWLVQLTEQIKTSGRNTNLVLANRKGLAVVAKVFTGKTMPANNEMHMKRSNYPDADSVFSPISDAAVLDPSAESSTASVIGHDPGYALWFLFDYRMALPEYLVEYEYICQYPPLTPRQSVGMASPAEGINTADSLDDEDVLLLEPVFPPKPRLVVLTRDVLLRHCGVPSLESVRVLNLHNNGLTQLWQLDSMPELRKLVVSHNELSRVDGIANLDHLRHLVLSHNKLTTLEGLQNLGSLQHLDVSWNQLENIRGSLQVLRKHCTSVVSLDLRHNPWRKHANLRLHVLGRLKQLKTFDGQPVTESETASALRLLLSSRVSVAMLLSRSRTDQNELKSLDLCSTAEVTTRMSRNRPERLTDDDTTWWSKITTLNVDSQGLSKLSNLDQLVNLKWASFAHNYISKIEGLDACMQLLELSLEDNCVTKTDGLAHLTALVRLNLSCNTLMSLDGQLFSQFSHLQQLNIDRNRISSLEGLQHCASLFELCAASNRISNTRSVFCLKSLQNFTILDLYGNPVTETENYRLHMIFHLQTLRSLDGTVIEASDSNLAREIFGGRLTQDFVADRLGYSDFSQLSRADFSHMGIKQVDLGNTKCFQNLTSINLEHNDLTAFEGLTALSHLKILCLNYNHIESLFPGKSRQAAGGVKNSQLAPLSVAEAATPVLSQLQVLHLGYNGIMNMAQLQLWRLPALQSLFLQANEIVTVDGLDGMTSLRELVLDRNKIKCLGPNSFASQSNLVELHMEENRLRDLSHFDQLQSLSRLYLGMNKISDLAELENLVSLTNLKELSVISNPVSKKQTHRPMLVFRLPQLECIDGIAVTEEEQVKSDSFFVDQLQTSPLSPDTHGGFQGNWKVPVKMTSLQMPLGRYSNERQSPGSIPLATYGPQANALPQREHPSNARQRKGDTGFSVYDVPNAITGVDGQLYHGSDRSLFPRPLGLGRQAAQLHSTQRYSSTYGNGYDWNQHKNTSHRRPNRRSGPN